MAKYTKVDLPYAPLGPYKVWVLSRDHFKAGDFKKNTDPDSKRQKQFIAEVKRLSDHLGTADVPVFVHWPNAGRLRMDKGCIGHAISAGAINEPENSSDGFVERIELAGCAT